MAQIVCKQCGKAVEKRTGTMFCCPQCKNSYWNGKTPQTKEEKPETNVLNPKKQELADEKPLSSNNKIPPEQIEIDKNAYNPELMWLNNGKSFLELQYKRLMSEKKQIISTLSNFDTPIKNHCTIVGAITAVVATAKSQSAITSLIALGIGSVAGNALGKRIDKQMKEQCLITKPTLIMELANIEERLKVFASRIMEVDGKILCTPKTITIKVMQPNPAFKEYKQKLRLAHEVEVLTQRQKELKLEEDRKAEEHKKPLGKIISSSQLANIPFNALNFTGKWKGFLGLPSVGFLMVIHGKPGGGKSTFSVKLAHYLAEIFGEALFVSGEEGFSKTLKDKLVNSNAISKDLSFADLHSLSDVLEHVPQGRFNFILLDSLNNMRIDTAGLQQLRDHFKGCAIIAIAQSTKDGKMRGSNEIIHDCDIEVSVSNGIATTIKNRFFKTGTNYSIFDEPEAPIKEPPVVKLPKNIIE